MAQTDLTEPTDFSGWLKDGGVRSVRLLEGQMWVLPGDLPHGRDCSALVHEVELRVRDIVAGLSPVFERFHAHDGARTCQACGALHPGKG